MCLQHQFAHHGPLCRSWRLLYLYFWVPYWNEAVQNLQLLDSWQWHSGHCTCWVNICLSVLLVNPCLATSLQWHVVMPQKLWLHNTSSLSWTFLLQNCWDWGWACTIAQDWDRLSLGQGHLGSLILHWAIDQVCQEAMFLTDVIQCKVQSIWSFNLQAVIGPREYFPWSLKVPMLALATQESGEISDEP